MAPVLRIFAFSGLLGLLSCDHTPQSPSDAPDPSFTKGGGTRLDIRTVTRLPGDGSVRVRVKVRCPRRLEVLEAFVTVSQENAYGEAPIRATCTGRTQRSRVSVTPQEGSFGPGVAVVSGLLLVEDPVTFETEQDQDTETVRLRRGPKER